MIETNNSILKPQKVLLIGMANSIHVMRWMRQFDGSRVQFTLFPSTPHRKIHPLLAEMIENSNGNYSVKIASNTMKYFALPIYYFDQIFKNRLRSHFLSRLLKNYDFNLIHVHELQHGGYLALSAFKNKVIPPILISNWGSDLYWFRNFPRHLTKLKGLLQLANFYSAECQRDIQIAKELGFTGVCLPVIPNAGGLSVDDAPIHYVAPSSRKKIIIKGYTGFVGRALWALRAIKDVGPHLDGYEIIVYSASWRAIFYSRYLSIFKGISVKTFRPGLSHQVMLEMFRESRIYIGISLSDGISTSLLEAMSTGCFPIQTCTSCADEWLSSSSGFIVQPHDHQNIVLSIKTALTNDQLVDDAARENMRIIGEKGLSRKVELIAKETYESILRAM